jgi:peptide-methionine (S)-S-oxide reductase
MLLFGYIGVKQLIPYKEICNGDTGHAEAIEIFDPAKIGRIFWRSATHDPTTINRQGNDVNAIPQ